MVPCPQNPALDSISYVELMRTNPSYRESFELTSHENLVLLNKVAEPSKPPS